MKKLGTKITHKEISRHFCLDREYGDECFEVAGLIKKLCTWRLHPHDLVQNPPEFLEFSETLASFPYRGVAARRQEMILCAIDEIIKGHGTEASFEEGYFSDPIVSWINTGDTYSSTVALYGGNFYLTTLGEMVEKLEKLGVQVS